MGCCWGSGLCLASYVVLNQICLNYLICYGLISQLLLALDHLRYLKDVLVIGHIHHRLHFFAITFVISRLSLDSYLGKRSSPSFLASENLCCSILQNHFLFWSLSSFLLQLLSSYFKMESDCWFLFWFDQIFDANQIVHLWKLCFLSVVLQWKSCHHWFGKYFWIYCYRLLCLILIIHSNRPYLSNCFLVGPFFRLWATFYERIFA